MHDPDATFAVVQAFSQEGSEPMPGFIPVQAVQVDFVLNHPASTPQIAQDILGQSAAQIMRLVTTFKPVLQANSAMQAFMQGSLFVGQMLERAGRRWPCAMLDHIGWRQRRDAGHGSPEFGLNRIKRGNLPGRPGFCGG